MITVSTVLTVTILVTFSADPCPPNNTIESEPKLNTMKYFHSISEISNENFENEELFMIPNNLPITTGINYSCFKWKPADKITFNLLFEDDNEDVDVYTTNFKKLKHFAKIRNNTPEGMEYIKSIRSLENYKFTVGTSNVRLF